MPVVQIAQFAATSDGGIRRRARRAARPSGTPSGWRTIARPSATRCRSPAERPETERSSSGSMRSSLRRLRRRARAIPPRGTPCAFQRKADVLARRSYADRARTAGTRRRCRARAARLKVTSSPSSRMRPTVGSSSPAIMRSVVVLPQPDGPSRQKNAPILDHEIRVLDRDEIAEGLVQFLDCGFPPWRPSSLRKVG